MAESGFKLWLPGSSAHLCHKIPEEMSRKGKNDKMGKQNRLPCLTKFMNGKSYEENNVEKIMNEICSYISWGTQFIKQYPLNT